MIGLACAWRLSRRGAGVVVVDRSDRGAATRVAAGMLAPVGELQFREEALLEISLAAAAGYGEFVAEVEGSAGLSAGFTEQGALHVALDRDEAGELRRRHDLQRSRGLEAEWLGPRGCRELEPGLAPSLNGGVHVPGEGAVDPRALARGLTAGIEAGEGAVLRDEAVELLVGDGSVRGLRTGAGEELAAPAVVVATGAWGGEGGWLPPEARPPVRPVKGQILELGAGAAGALSERIVASERVYLVPRSDGRTIVGATMEERGFDVSVTAGGVHELLREAYRLLPDVAELELLEATAGLRPGTADNLPLIGAGAIDGLLLATGHHRNGVLLAGLTADAIARLVAGEEPPAAAAAADPLRFAGTRPLAVGR